jgi:hypothetical protein
MKKHLSILFVVVLSLGLLLAACGGSAETDPDAILGTWVDNGDGVSTLSFSENGMQFNDGDPATFAYDGSTLIATLSDGSTINYTYTISGDTLTLTEDTGNVYTFTRQ